MSVRKKVSAREKALIRRYLIWCYQTTRESLDRVDRKFTQAVVDRYVLARIQDVKVPAAVERSYDKLVEDFKVYIANKEKEGLGQKFIDGKKNVPHPQYFYLYNRLSAVEAAIQHFLDPRELIQIALLYEQEMTRRILESREH